MCDVIRNRRQRIRTFSLWFLASLLSFGYLQPLRAGSALDTFFDNLDSPSAFEDYFRDWFKRANGPNRGKNQVFLLPGVVIGPIAAVQPANVVRGSGLPICRQRRPPTIREQLDL
jgi:hypothetical protein